MKKIISLVLLLLSWSSLQAKIPLSAAIKRGIQINLKVQNQLLDEKIKKSEKGINKRKRLFSLNLGGSYFTKTSKSKSNFPPRIWEAA